MCQREIERERESSGLRALATLSYDIYIYIYDNYHMIFDREILEIYCENI